MIWSIFHAPSGHFFHYNPIKLIMWPLEFFVKISIVMIQTPFFLNLIILLMITHTINTLQNNDNTITNHNSFYKKVTGAICFLIMPFVTGFYVCICRKYCGCALNRSIYYLMHHVLVIDKVTLNNKRPPTRNVNIA